MMTTDQIRKEYLNRRNALSEDFRREMSQKLCALLLAEITSRDASHILGFAPIGSEPLLGPLYEDLHAEGRQLYFPVTRKGEIQFYAADTLSELKPGAFHIPEPADGSRPYPEDAATDTFAIVPGLVFDRHGYRIGYGGGYYDRYLSAHPGIWKAMAAFHIQMYEDIPYESWDVPMNEIVTDLRIIEVKLNE